MTRYGGCLSVAVYSLSSESLQQVFALATRNPFRSNSCPHLPRKHTLRSDHPGNGSWSITVDLVGCQPQTGPDPDGAST
jgi:hypothetical protein